MPILAFSFPSSYNYIFLKTPLANSILHVAYWMLINCLVGYENLAIYSAPNFNSSPQWFPLALLASVEQAALRTPNPQDSVKLNSVTAKILQLGRE